MSLRLQDVHKQYRQPGGELVPVLNIEKFEIGAAEQVVLVGESGCGKTTLLNVVAGITTADRGLVEVDGHDLTRMSEATRDRFRAQKIGYVFQTFNLLSAFSALENVILGMSFSGKKTDRRHAQELLESVGLKHRMTHRPGQLSVGEQQRVAVARALANRPTLLLADEPTANVDLANQDMILKLIREGCREHGVSLLMVTHSAEVAGQFDRQERLTEFNRVGVAV